MATERSCYYCKRLDSFTSPCPQKEDKTIMALKALQNVGGTVKSDVFDKAVAIATKCDLFEERKG